MAEKNPPKKIMGASNALPPFSTPISSRAGLLLIKKMRETYKLETLTNDSTRT